MDYKYYIVRSDDPKIEMNNVEYESDDMETAIRLIGSLARYERTLVVLKQLMPMSYIRHNGNLMPVYSEPLDSLDLHEGGTKADVDNGSFFIMLYNQATETHYVVERTFFYMYMQSAGMLLTPEMGRIKIDGHYVRAMTDNEELSYNMDPDGDSWPIDQWGNLCCDDEIESEVL